jgi:hypothetical protein
MSEESLVYYQVCKCGHKMVQKIQERGFSEPISLGPDIQITDEYYCANCGGKISEANYYGLDLPYPYCLDNTPAVEKTRRVMVFVQNERFSYRILIISAKDIKDARRRLIRKALEFKEKNDVWTSRELSTVVLSTCESSSPKDLVHQYTFLTGDDEEIFCYQGLDK